MEQMVGYDCAIVIDAYCSGSAGHDPPPGPGDMPTQCSALSHDMSLPTALTFGRQAGLRLPEDAAIVLVGIEVGDISDFRRDVYACRGRRRVAGRGRCACRSRLPRPTEVSV